MAKWQLGRKGEARASYDKAVAWIEKHNPDRKALQRLRAEAEEVLGIEEAKNKATR